ncbi:MAG TPA: hypothetical protein VIF57_21810 [Polyangia bacterium]|jgi:uncharacterized membrane protein
MNAMKMKMKSGRFPLWRVLGLAAITGSRTTFGPALAARASVKRPVLRAIATLLAAAELIGDKLPGVPNRTAPSNLVPRIASAAGLALALRPRRRRWRRRPTVAATVALAAGAAVAAAFAGLPLRRALTRLLGGGRIGNALAGAVEDAALIAIGTRVARG